MFLINYNSNDYQPVAESPCQMLVSVLTVLLSLFLFFHLWKLLGELSPTITHGSTQSEVSELPKDLGNKETQLYRHRPTVSLRGSEDLSCSDDKPFRVAHPILESSGVGQHSDCCPGTVWHRFPRLISRSGTRWPLQTPSAKLRSHPADPAAI